MKNLFFAMAFMLVGGFAFAQSACACSNSSGTSTASCEAGSECSCSSRDGGCFCGCSPKPEVKMIDNSFSHHNHQINNCGVMNANFVTEQMNLKLEKLNNQHSSNLIRRNSFRNKLLAFKS